MSEQHSVTAWFDGLYQGDEDAATRLVERYLDRLVGLGRQTYRRRFGDIPRPTEDEEDAALSAFDSFCAAVKAGQIRHLQNRHELWGLLVKIMIRKVYDQRDRITAKKRGGRDASMAVATDDLDDFVGQLTGPEALAELRDTYRVAIEKLDDPELRQIAEMDLEGRTRAEIARALKLTERTV
jgi:DNA-directed RNA polymerase specialized sigma24 family protein